MYKFDEYCIRWDDHNTAINNEETTINIWPTIRIKYNEGFRLGFTLYKWKLEPSGDVLAIYPFGPEINGDDIIWKHPKKSLYTLNLQTEIKLIKDHLKSNKISDIINDIKNNIREDIIIYKYHANQWRQITKKKTKWAYIEKATKSDTCNIQRLLDN